MTVLTADGAPSIARLVRNNASSCRAMLGAPSLYCARLHRDGTPCKVIGGVHAGKSGIAMDINISKTGHVTITVVQPNGERFKTLAKNVVIEK